MKYFPLLLCLLLGSCMPPSKPLTIVVSNPSPLERENEMVEIPVRELLERLQPTATEQFIVWDMQGRQVPYQLTYDDKLLFRTTLSPKATTSYVVALDSVMPYETLVSGRYSRADSSLVWENDRAAFRAFNASYGRNNDRAAGYDVWVKNTSALLLDEWFDYAASQADSLRMPARLKRQGVTGMDAYRAAHTPGCGGTLLLLGDSTLVYPQGWEDYEILDNGPLRFTVRLRNRYRPIADSIHVTETRLISLDAGSRLNQITIHYDTLPPKVRLFTALPMRTGNHAYAAETGLGILSYANPTDSLKGEYGIVYVGCVMPQKIERAGTWPLAAKEAMWRGAIGYVYALTRPDIQTPFTYKAGAAWQDETLSNHNKWVEYLSAEAEKTLHPLRIELK